MDIEFKQQLMNWKEGHDIIIVIFFLISVEMVKKRIILR